MADGLDSRTSTTLIDRLQEGPADSAAWEEFAGRYRPLILDWCRSWGLQDADSQDVAQAVLLKLVSAIRQYRREPSQQFRGWLRVVSQRVWLDLRSRRDGFVGGEAGRLLLENAEARQTLDRQLADLFDAEQLQAAYGRVRARVEDATWQAFQLMALEGLSGREVSLRLNMPVAHVYVAKHRVQKLLREELQEPVGDETIDLPLRTTDRQA